MFELNKIYTMQAPIGEISESGVKEIEMLIGAIRVNEGEWLVKNPGSKMVYLPMLPESWQWVWVVSKGDYVGTLSNAPSFFA